MIVYVPDTFRTRVGSGARKSPQTVMSSRLVIVPVGPVRVTSLVMGWHSFGVLISVPVAKSVVENESPHQIPPVRVLCRPYPGDWL